MRVITKKRLEEFTKMHPNSKASLKFWYDIVTTNNFYSINEVLLVFNKADFVGNERFVFDISRNKYRLIAKFKLHPKAQRVYIRFIGTHIEYDNIEDIKNI